MELQDPARVAEVEVTHHPDVDLVYVNIHGRQPGSAQLTPDEADELADALKAHAAAAREDVGRLSHDAGGDEPQR